MVEHFAQIFMCLHIPFCFLPGICLCSVYFFRFLLFADPDSTWYLHATSFVMFNMFLSSELLLINATSSMHKRRLLVLLCSSVLGRYFL